jgi:hypothetical protein
VAALLAPQSTPAQGVITCLDNTSQAIAGSMSLGASIGVQFQTGANPAGYMLNNIELLFVPSVGHPVGTSLYLNVFEDYSGGLGNAIALLDTKDDPTTAGLSNFQPSSIPLLDSSSQPLFLASNQKYWLVLLSVSGSSSSDSFELSYVNTTDAMGSDGWSITGNTALGQIGIPMFSIDVTAVPEPSTFILVILGGALIASKIKPTKAAKHTR